MSRHVVITGGAGFIGHHTIEHLLKNTDWYITTVDRLTYAGNLNRLTDIDCWEKEKGRVRFVYHDFRAPLPASRLWEYFSKPSYFIHMGAESHVDRSIQNPVLFAESNVVGTVNMLETARDLDIQKFLYVSTDEVYGPSIDGHLHKEGEPHKPGNPYSASKSAGESFVYSYWNTYGLPVIITNTMNNFGERQDVEKFVPKVIRAIANGEPVTIHVKMEHGTTITDISSRCWLHARNHADAIMFLLEKGTPGERYNVTGDRYNVADIACMIANFMKLPPFLVNEDFHSFRRGHDMHYGLDGTKLAECGWKPPLDMFSSLERTVNWYMNHREWLQ